jgi:hypothetical protein
MKKIKFYAVLLIFLSLFAVRIEGKADSWGEPVRTESVRETKSVKKVRNKTKAKKTKTVNGKKNIQTSSTTKFQNSQKIITTVTTVTQKITKYKKGSRTVTVTTKKTVTTRKDTYSYYYNLRTGISQNGQQNISMDLNLLRQYCPQKIVNLLKAQDIKIYLYATHSILEKPGIVGLTVWNKSEKTSYIKNDHWYVILHETGHLLDCYAKESTGTAGNYSSNSEYFEAVFQKDQLKVTGSYQTSVKEYFAESFMYYYLRPTTLKSERPDTYQAIRLFVENL